MTNEQLKNLSTVDPALVMRVLDWAEWDASRGTEHKAGSPEHALAVKGAQFRIRRQEKPTDPKGQVSNVATIGDHIHVHYGDDTHAVFSKGAKDLTPSVRNVNFKGYPLSGQKKDSDGEQIK